VKRVVPWLAALAAACASTPTPPPAPPMDAPWTTGRLSVRVEAEEGRPEQGLSAHFELRGSGRQGELRLSSALGNRLAQARWAPEGALLSTPDGDRRYSDLGELARSALGEALPLAALPDWLAGLPWPGAAHVAREGGFEQLGWQVDLRRHAQGFVFAQRAAPPQVTLRVKLDAAVPP
jgi:outer membrane lipoprotein LolB